LLDPLEIANLDHWTRFSFRNVIVFRTSDDGQSPDTKYNTPSSESFRTEERVYLSSR